MLRIDRILCPVDFSDFSARAYDYAQSLGRHYRANVFLQHVVDFMLPSYAYYADAVYIDELFQKVRTDARDKLHEFAKLHTVNGIQPECLLDEGPVAKSILSCAEGHSANLIVMGSHGMGGVDRVVLGSVAEKVLRKAHCSVLMIRKPAHDFVNPESTQDPIQLRRILFCTDFSLHSEAAFTRALSVAMEYGAQLTLLHVLEHAPSSADLQNTMIQVQMQIEEPVPPEVRSRCAVESAVRIGKPFEQIIQLALEAQADMVILGVRGRSALDLALFGSTSYRVIQLGPCPVLAVHV